jgi:hypothetical protein
MLLHFLPSGLGVPGRRYSLGEFHRGFSLSGAGKNLEAPVLKAFAYLGAPAATEEFAFEDVECLIGLSRTQHVQPNGPCHKVGQLQSRRIDLLVGEALREVE